MLWVGFAASHARCGSVFKVYPGVGSEARCTDVVCCWESHPSSPTSPCPLFALLQSLCTPANTRLITPLSIGPRFAPKGRGVLSSPCCLSISSPHIGLYSLLSFLSFFCFPLQTLAFRRVSYSRVLLYPYQDRMLWCACYTLKPVWFGMLFIIHVLVEVDKRQVWKCAQEHCMRATLAPAQMFVLVVKSRIRENGSLPLAALWGLLF